MTTETDLAAQIQIEGTRQPFTVRSLKGREGIGELFRFDVGLHCDDPALDLDSFVGAAAHLVVSRAGFERHFHGMLLSFEQTSSDDAGSIYSAVLVPQAAWLDIGCDFRTFAGMTALEVAQQVLSEGGVTGVQVAVTEALAKRDIVVQYRESDWSFVARLLEDEGLHCFFEHDEAGATLRICDATASHPDISDPVSIAMRKVGNDEGVDSFELYQRIQPGSVTLRDYPLDQPLGVNEETAAADGAGKGKIDFFDFPDRGAKRRLQAIQAGRRRGRGSAATLRMVPGAVFQLEGHARDSFNSRWLLTTVEHDAAWDQGAGNHYTVTFECAPAELPYRPGRRVPKPRILGAQMAQIVGPDGVEIHTDEAGRVLAVFHWNHHGSSLQQACWLPVAQLAASRGFGAVHLPRVGDTVLVEFLDGDPDRPMVVGSLYHKVNTPPYALPGSRAKAVFRDRSTPGGNGYNELTFDSSAGAEEVYLRAQRNSRTEVLRDATRTVGQDDALSVERDRKVEVKGAASRTVGKDDAESVGGSQSVSVGGSQSVSVGGSQSVAVTGDQQIAVTGDRSLSVAGDCTFSCEGDVSSAVVGDVKELVEGSRTVEIAGDHTTTIAGSEVKAVEGSRVESVEGNLQLVVEGLATHSFGAATMSVTGATEISCAGDVLVESATSQRLGAPKIYIAAGSRLYLRALEAIELQVGDSKLTIEPSKITISNGSSTKKLIGDSVHINC